MSLFVLVVTTVFRMRSTKFRVVTRTGRDSLPVFFFLMKGNLPIEAQMALLTLPYSIRNEESFGLRCTLTPESFPVRFAHNALWSQSRSQSD